MIYITIHDDSLPGTLKDMSSICENGTEVGMLLTAKDLIADCCSRRNREDAEDETL